MAPKRKLYPTCPSCGSHEFNLDGYLGYRELWDAQRNDYTDEKLFYEEEFFNAASCAGCGTDAAVLLGEHNSFYMVNVRPRKRGLPQIARDAEEPVPARRPRRSKHDISPRFPFTLLAYLGEDGQPVVEVDTAGAPRYHDSHTEPYLRVYVNDDRCSEYTGPEEWKKPRPRARNPRRS
jgi:hypothetical protein